MSQSLAKNLIHLIFSTKNREPILLDSLRDELHAYFSGVLRDLESPTLAISSVPDHIHILFILNKNRALSDVVMEIKRATSKWLKTKSPELAQFHWQNGYGAFSVSQSHVDDVTKYIERQHEHHRRVTFEDELREFFKRFQMQFDERYVWD